MLNLLRTPEAARTASAILVVIVAGLIGRQAAVGMEPSQWIGAIAAVLGSIVLAALVHTAPEPQKVRVRDDD